MLVGIMNSCHATDKPTCKPPITFALVYIVWMLIASKHRYVKSNDLPKRCHGSQTPEDVLLHYSLDNQVCSVAGRFIAALDVCDAWAFEIQVPCNEECKYRNLFDAP